MEEEKEIQKSYKGIAIILGLLLICSIGYIVYDKVLSNKESSGNVEEKKDGKQEESNQNVEKELTDVAYKEKLDRFMNLVKDYEEDAAYALGGAYLKELALGVSRIPEKNKIYYLLLYLGRNQSFMNNVTMPDKYLSRGSLYQQNDYMRLSFDTFNDAYKSFYVDAYDLNRLEEFYGEKNGVDGSFGNCPSLFTVDKENSNLYFIARCGGTSGLIGAFIETYKYTYDNDYYYVYTSIGYSYSDTYDGDGNDVFKYAKISDGTVVGTDMDVKSNLDKFDNVVWKFDKDFRFVGTENINNK